MAILAVAFVVLAAVPAALTDSDAARGTSSTADGVAINDVADADVTTAADTSYYVEGDKSAKNVILTGGVTGFVLYVKEGASIGIQSSNASTTTITVYVAQSKADGKVTYYPDSKATLSSSTTAVSSTYVLSVSDGVLTFGKVANLNLLMVEGMTVTYTDKVLGYPTGVIGTTKSLKVGQTATASTASTPVAESVVFGILTDDKDDSYKVAVHDGTNKAEFSGVFGGQTAGTISVAYISGLKATADQSVGSGSIKRVDGTLQTNDGNIPSTVLENGMYDGTSWKLEVPATPANSDSATITLVKGTQLNDGMSITNNQAAAQTQLKLSSGFKTAGVLTLTLSNSGADATIASDAAWSGVIEAQDTVGVLTLGLANGNVTVKGDDATITEVKTVAGGVLSGALKLEDGTKMTINNGLVVASNGSIDIVGKEDQGSTMNFVSVSSGKQLDLLGTISGDGTLKLADNNAKVYTVDGKKSNITCKYTAADIQADAAVGLLNGAAGSYVGTDGLSKLASMGYQNVEIQDYLLVDFDEKGYEFPSGVKITFKNADGNGIGISGDPDKKKDMNVTVPSGTEIVTVAANATGPIYAADVHLGVTHSTGMQKWVAQTKTPVTLNVEGKITGTGDITATAAKTDSDGEATLNEKAVVNLAESGVIGPDVEIYVPSITGAKKEMHISGMSDTTRSIDFPVYQKVIVDSGATWNVTDGNVIKVLGELDVDGAIVVKNGGELHLGDADMPLAYADVADSITVENGGKLYINNCEVTVSGQMDLNGELFPGVGKLTLKGQMNVGATGVLGAEDADNFEYAVSAKGSMTVSGYLDAQEIANSGTVVIDNAGLTARDGAAAHATVVSMLSTSAALNLKSYFVEVQDDSLTITDAGLELGKIGGSKRTVGADGPDANVVTVSAAALANMTGEIAFAEVFENSLNDDVRTYRNILQMSGAVSNTSVSANNGNVQTIVIEISKDAGNVPRIDDVAFETFVQVPADKTLKVEKDIRTTIANSGELKVAGYLDMTTAQTKDVTYLTDNGTMTVTGKAKINSQAIAGTGVLNAAHYITKEGSPTVTYNVYSSLSAAAVDILDASNTNTDKTITIYGRTVLTQNLEVNSPIAIKFATQSKDTSSLVVSEEGTNDVVMTVADGAKITSARNQVIVNGTMKIQNKETGDKTVKTVCDVTITSDDAKDIVYTNIYTALATAPSGSTVNVTREVTEEAPYVELYAPISIGEGVTLVVSENVAPLYLKDGVTLYVNGILQTSQDITAESKFGTQAMNVAGTPEKQTSAVVVNGKMLTLQRVTYSNYNADSPRSMEAGAPIAGAYYSIDRWFVVSTMEIAQQDYSKIKSSDITVHGALVAGDLSFAKTSSDDCTNITVPSETVNVPGGNAANAVSTSLSFTSLTVDEFKLNAVGSVSGTVQNDSSAVVLKSVKGTAGTKTVTAADSSGKLVLSGDAVSGTIRVSKGTVYAGTAQSQFISESSVKTSVASGVVLEGVNATIDDLVVEGTLNIASGESVTVKDSTIVGSVKVATGSDTSNGGTMQITGTVGIGISASDVASAKSSSSAPAPSAKANVSGPVTYSAGSVIIVLSGATMDKDAVSGLSAKVSTEFYVEDSLWITVYADSNNTKKISDYADHDIVDALFKNWQNAEGTDVTKTDYIGATDFKKVYADVEYEVFNIVLKADEGIDNVSLVNGSEIIKLGKGTVQQGSGIWYNAFTATVKAGTYTVQYTLKNGYSGTATLIGDGVSGMTFKAAGTPTSEAGIDIGLQLTGIEKSGYVEPVEDKDEGLTLTDYLLIIMVVLVVVLAVVIASRLLRS